MNDNNINNNIENNTVPVNPQDKFVMQQLQIVNSNTVQMPQVNNTVEPQPVQTPVAQTPVNQMSGEGLNNIQPQPIPGEVVNNIQPQPMPGEVVNNIQPQPMPGQDPNAMINENLKKVEVNNYKPPSKFKIVLLVLFFIILIAFVLFLPEITALIKKYQSGGLDYQKEEKITTGKLVCSMQTSTTNLDKDYDFTFNFKDSKLTSTKFITITRGDATNDVDELNELVENCKKLNTEVKSLEGVTVSCDYQEGKLVEKQTLELEVVEEEKLDAAFTEAGGMLSGYTYEQDIDEIEKNMKVSGYTCIREK